MIDARRELLSLRDEDNAAFAAKLIPCGHEFLGARTPELRELAKRISEEDLDGYLGSWSPEFFEDYMLRGMAIGYAKVPLERRLRLYEDFVPLIDNWSVCDSLCSTWKPRPEEKDRLWEFLMPCIESGEEFRMRFAAVMMMDHFLDEGHVDAVIAEMDRARCEGYYMKMAVAWCLATCMAKFPERTMEYLKGDNSLDNWTTLKTIQKSLESRRVPDGTKDELRAMRTSIRKAELRLERLSLARRMRVHGADFQTLCGPGGAGASGGDRLRPGQGLELVLHPVLRDSIAELLPAPLRDAVHVAPRKRVQVPQHRCGLEADG